VEPVERPPAQAARPDEERNPYAGWTRFELRGTEVSVWLPGKPTYKSVDQEVGNQKFTRHEFTLKKGKVTYNFCYFDLVTPATPTGDRIDTVLDAGVQGVLKGRKLIEAKAITLQGYRGREVELASGRSIVKARIYLMGRRSYMLIVQAEMAAASPPEADVFLQSLMLKC
jgi:hypothetical protein